MGEHADEAIMRWIDGPPHHREPRPAATVTYRCPYCGAPATIRDSAEIYGTSYGKALICTARPKCDAFVGCHKDSGLPKGTMALGPLRNLRKAAHAAFDPLWMKHHWNRREAYVWLASTLQIPAEECHIGMFDEDRCRRTITACNKLNGTAK